MSTPAVDVAQRSTDIEIGPEDAVVVQNVRARDTADMSAALLGTPFQRVAADRLFAVLVPTACLAVLIGTLTR